MSHLDDMDSLSNDSGDTSDSDTATDSDESESTAGSDSNTGAETKTSTGAANVSFDSNERAEEMSYDSVGENLNVGAETKELFKYIGRYKPKVIELDTHLKPFLPDFAPSIGELDSFMKVGRPDKEPDVLGIQVLDEPAATQTDSQILIMQLRAQNKTSFRRDDEIVRSIENAEKNQAAIDKWINSVASLHEQKPLPEVQYAKTMPSIDSLMQVWPEEFEQALILNSNDTFLPADLDMPLQDFATTACALVDIPVYPNHLIHSVHQLFTLWSEFRNNQHFKVLAEQMEQCEGTDYRPTTAAAIEATMEFSDARPSTAHAIQAAIDESMKTFRPDTSSGVNAITGNYRPDTAAAIAAVAEAEQREALMARPDTAAAIAAVAAMEDDGEEAYNGK